MDSMAALLARKPIDIISGYAPLVGYSRRQHATELYDVLGDCSPWDVCEAPEVECHEFYRIDFHDGRRYYSLFGVRFKETWVMVCRSAGREGDDHQSKFILDGPKYAEMIVYLAGVIAGRKAAEALEENPPVVHEGDGVESLYEFYGEDVRYPPYRF